MEWKKEEQSEGIRIKAGRTVKVLGSESLVLMTEEQLRTKSSLNLSFSTSAVRLWPKHKTMVRIYALECRH